MINKLFNKKQLDLLSEAEEYFRQVRSGFKRNSPHTLDVKVYETLNSIEPTQEPKYSCSKCVYNLYKRASEIYFISKEKNNQDKTDKEDGQMEKKNARQQPTNTNSNATTATRQSSIRVKRKGKKNSSN